MVHWEFFSLHPPPAVSCTRRKRIPLSDIFGNRLHRLVTRLFDVPVDGFRLFLTTAWSRVNLEMDVDGSGEYFFAKVVRNRKRKRSIFPPLALRWNLPMISAWEWRWKTSPFEIRLRLRLRRLEILLRQPSIIPIFRATEVFRDFLLPYRSLHLHRPRIPSVGMRISENN